MKRPAPLDWFEGVMVGASTISVGYVSPWYEVRIDGQARVLLGDERHALNRARQLFMALQPEDRPSCPVCGRAVGLVSGGKLSFHNDQPSMPGRAVPARRCPGTGHKLSAPRGGA